MTQTQHNLPKPETLRAILVSAGYRKPTTTVHHYYETRPLPPDADGRVGFEFIFRCFRSGADRRWGVWFPDTPLPPPAEGDEPSGEGAVN